jgi:flagellar motor switch protein FliG
MPPLSPALRKAAVLISALDERTADALLDQMGRQEAAKVRSALVELDEIPIVEQQAVLAEFLRQQADSGVSLELDSAVAPPAETGTPEAQPLAFLRDVAPHDLARVLRSEQPQTVAVVAAHLPPEQAAALLEQLPAMLSTDALERMAWLDDLTPEIAADLARSLRRQLGPCLSSTPRPQSAAHRAAVLAAMQNRLRPEASVPSQAAVIAQRYRLETAPAAGGPLVAFDDLTHLSDEDLRQVLGAAGSQLALLALTGADERLVSRILKSLPAKDAAVLRRRLEHPGPVQLREIEQARASLAATAARLATSGQIALPKSMAFAAAV